jgi:uncharacterized protein YqeY
MKIERLPNLLLEQVEKLPNMIKLGTGKSREMCSYISKDFFREYLKAGKFDRLKDRTLRKTGEPNGRIFGYFSNHYKDFFISKIGDIFKLLFLEILDFDIEDGSFSIRNVCERKAVLDGFSHNKVFQVNYFFLKESTFYFVNEKILFGIRIPLDLATELVKMKDELKAEGFAVEAETFETGFITFGNIDTFIDLIPKNKRLEAEATISRIKERKERERKDSIEQYLSGGRPELAEKEKAEVDILSVYLPSMMDESAVEVLVKEVIQEANASSKAELGKIMGLAMKKAAGQADGNLIRQMAERLLN